MEDYTKNPEALLATVSRLFTAKDHHPEIDILTKAIPSLEQTGYDNWDGGIFLYTLYLQVSPEIFSKYSDVIKDIEKSIHDKVTSVTRPYPRDYIQNILISPIIKEEKGWRQRARVRLASASVEEQFQAVGLLCRDVIISLAQTVYDKDRHGNIDDVSPSKSDAKRMLEAYISVEMSGSSNEYGRKYAKAAFDFANNLTHKRTANFKDAALCSEATASLINIIAIVSGRRS